MEYSCVGFYTSCKASQKEAEVNGTPLHTCSFGDLMGRLWGCVIVSRVEAELLHI